MVSNTKGKVFDVKVCAVLLVVAEMLQAVNNLLDAIGVVVCGIVVSPAVVARDGIDAVLVRHGCPFLEKNG